MISQFWFHSLRNWFITVAVCDLFLPLSLTKRLVNHTRPSDITEGYALVEGNGGVRSSPVSVPERAPRDWRSQCERERARADAAEAGADVDRRGTLTPYRG